MLEDLERRLERYKEDIAAAIPGYLGYRQRERRRDADRQLRMELARQYDAQRDRLLDLQRQATRGGLLEALDDIERANLKLQHFIDRLRTASYGYAGWFETASVREPELEQLYAFDQTLAAGIDRVAAEVDAMAEAIQAGNAVEDMTDALITTLDELHQRFDQRRDLLAEGKKVPPAELQEALRVKPGPGLAYQMLAGLKIDDALSYEGVDYLVVGKVTYDVKGAVSYAYLLEDGGTQRWLRVGGPPHAGEPDIEPDLALYEAMDIDVGETPGDTIDGFRQVTTGSARASVAGPGGRREGMVTYWLYQSPAGERLWIERWGEETRVHRGAAIDVERLQVWPRR